MVITKPEVCNSFTLNGTLLHTSPAAPDKRFPVLLSLKSLEVALHTCENRCTLTVIDSVVAMLLQFTNYL
jgi:hypothetical protein